MNLEIREEPMSTLAAYGRIPIAFEATRVLEVELVDGGRGGVRLTERPVAKPWTKDYDAIVGEGPTRWAKRFDLTNWGLLAAFDGDDRIGGAVLAYDTPGVDQLGGRNDLAVIWDLRVRPDRRGIGVGRLLFAAATAWAKARGCRWLKIETQNINVPACRFYAANGCELGGIDRFAYPAFPDETALYWYRELAP